MNKLFMLFTLLLSLILTSCGGGGGGGGGSSSSVDSGTEAEQAVFDETTFGATTFD